MTVALGGCGTAIVTPFLPDTSLDLPALRRLVDWQIDSGITFLTALGTTGEAHTLSPEERAQVVRTIVEQAAGRVPVMAGITSNDTRQAVDEAQRLGRLGITWLMMAQPYYNKPSTEGVLRHFQVVADAAPVPLCIYNNPGRTALIMKPETVLRLSDHGNICGVKDASGDLSQVQHLLLARPEGFAVLSGEDWMTLAIIAAGGDGLMSVVANEVPAEMAQLVAACLDERLGDARALLYQLLPLMEATFIETNPGPAKAALAAMGRIHNVLRLPLVPLAEQRLPPLLAALKEAGVAPTWEKA